MTETEKKIEKDRSGDENNLPKSIEYLQYISVFILLVLDGLLIAVILIVERVLFILKVKLVPCYLLIRRKQELPVQQG